jgi:hypothetical protein
MLLVAESCSACLKFRVDEETCIGWLEILLIAVGGVCLLGVAGVVICFAADTRQTYEMPGGETMFDALPQLENAPHRTRWANDQRPRHLPRGQSGHPTARRRRIDGSAQMIDRMLANDDAEAG